MEVRRAFFDEWAAHYDASVDDAPGFPFTGYRDVLAQTLNTAAPAPGQTVLDAGCGTGNLSLLFALAGCDVTGVDFSPVMLERARRRVPNARLQELNLLGTWKPLASQRFDVISSAYVFHEFVPSTRFALIARLVEEHLKPGGRMVVADINFSTRAEMDRAQAEAADAWDEEEFYWCAENALTAMRGRRLSVEYTPVPPFAGIYAVTRNSGQQPESGIRLRSLRTAS